MKQRIKALDPNTQEGKTKQLLDGVQASLGTVPNLARTLAHSAAALQGYLSFRSALGQSSIGARLAEQIAITVANANGCAYSNSLHSYLGQHVGELDATDLAMAKIGKATDLKSQAALVFSLAVLKSRGHIADRDMELLRKAGFSDTAIVEIIAHTALNTFINYFNNAAGTQIDFPVTELVPEAFL